MKWTKKWPKIDGFYWLKTGEINKKEFIKTHIVEIKNCEIVLLLGDDPLFFDDISCAHTFHVLYPNGIAKWYGPLEIPK